MIKILRTDIKKMYPIKKEKIIEGEYWFDNPQATRYFYAPNGNALKTILLKPGIQLRPFYGWEEDRSLETGVWIMA